MGIKYTIVAHNVLVMFSYQLSHQERQLFEANVASVAICLL